MHKLGLLQILAVLASILYYNSLRERHHLTRCAVLHPSMSPWLRLLNFGDDPSFLEMVGLDRYAFAQLKAVLFPAREILGLLKRGRPAYLDLDGKIGLYKLCVDQGFPRSGDLFDKFVGPLSVNARKNLAPVLRQHIIEQHNIYVSLRQSSEWGMRALQGSFSRLKSRLTSNADKRHNIILGIVLLHNFRTEFVGLNQIATVFNPHYEQYVNIDGYDRIARYYDNGQLINHFDLSLKI